MYPPYTNTRDSRQYPSRSHIKPDIIYEGAEIVVCREGLGDLMNEQHVELPKRETGRKAGHRCVQTQSLVLRPVG